jgi:hypothetical protein
MEAQLRAKLRVEALPERMRKALEFVRTNAVTLHADGTASVQSGKQTYTLAPDCPCADAKHRTELCKHTLAVELHRRALALLEGTAATPASHPTPAAPSPSHAAAAAALTPAAPSVPTSAAWDVHEAPVSSCFKIRVGAFEWTHTMRATDDTELHTRVQAFVPTFREVVAALDALQAERDAAKAAPAVPAPPPAAPATLPQADLQALVQQAVQQALAAANGQATPPLQAPPSNGTAQPAPTPEGWCALHQVPMELRSNERDSWWSQAFSVHRRNCGR